MVSWSKRAARAYPTHVARARSKTSGRSAPGSEAAPLVAIVDDDASVGRSTERLVRSLGYRTRAFTSGEEFLRSGTGALAACLLLDVRMPGMDGLEVQRSLLEGGMHIPIVFSTGRASDEEEQRARNAGAVAFLRKPVAQASLRRVLESVLHQRAPAGGACDAK